VAGITFEDECEEMKWINRK